MYYMLPYGDLIRLSVGYNHAFHDFFRGKYLYSRFHNGDKGTFSIKHDYIYTQHAYIHTFNYEKVGRIFMCQGKKFDTAKERRAAIKKIINE